MSGAEGEDFGTESFLDVITNSIGILIILVLVTGAKANQAVEAAAARPAEELAEATAEEATLNGDIERIAAQMNIVDRELAARFAERGQVSTLVRAIEQELAGRRAALGEFARLRYDAQRDLAVTNDELRRLERERDQASTTTVEETVKIENYPTPIGKTVDNKEVHFQLLGGRLTFVPFEALFDELRGVMRDLGSRLQDQNDLSDTLGPIGGFHLRYNVSRFDSPRGSYMQVTYVELLPVSSQLGELLESALAPKSTFRNKLEMLSPRQYTITVWTYPDSFAEFRKLKKELYGLGYAVAARPLPEGMPIGASPSGSKSSAE